jgi:hypothetical protein
VENVAVALEETVEEAKLVDEVKAVVDVVGVVTVT